MPSGAGRTSTARGRYLSSLWKGLTVASSRKRPRPQTWKAVTAARAPAVRLHAAGPAPAKVAVPKILI